MIYSINIKRVNILIIFDPCSLSSSCSTSHPNPRYCPHTSLPHTSPIPTIPSHSIPPKKRKDKTTTKPLYLLPSNPVALTRLPHPPPPSALKSLISASSSALCATLAPLKSLKLLPMLGVPSLRPELGAGAGEVVAEAWWGGGGGWC